MIDFPAGQVAEVADEVAVSAVTIAELQYGVAVASDPMVQMSRRRRVQAILDRFEVLSFGPYARGRSAAAAIGHQWPVILVGTQAIPPSTARMRAGVYMPGHRTPPTSMAADSARVPIM